MNARIKAHEGAYGKDYSLGYKITSDKDLSSRDRKRIEAAFQDYARASNHQHDTPTQEAAQDFSRANATLQGLYKETGATVDTVLYQNKTIEREETKSQSSCFASFFASVTSCFSCCDEKDDRKDLLRNRRGW